MSKRSVFLRVVTLVALLGVLIPASSASPVAVQANSFDTIAPSTVIGLSAQPGASPGSVELRWIAPGDDNSTGTAAAYVVRYNTVPIVVDEDENTWITSTDVTGEPVPNPAGSLESMTVTGLEMGRTYYFALRSEDEVSNVSGVSNLAMASPQTYPNAVYAPIVLSDYSETAIIPFTTVVIPISTTQYLESVSDDFTFTFSHMTPELAALEPGDVMVADVSPAAPDGFLRKVKEVTTLCDKIVVVTEFATLEEAVQTASVQTSQALKPSQVATAQYADGVTMSASPDGMGFEFNLEDLVLYDRDGDNRTKNDRITADGKIALDIGADVGIQIDWFQLKQFRFIANATETSEISVKYNYSLPITRTIPINVSFIKFSPFTVMAGPVPVVIKPEMSLVLDLEGNVAVAVTTGVSQEATLRLGATYENGYWSGIHEFNNKFEFNSPAIELSGSVMVGINPELTLKLYGVAGPYVGTVPYVKLEAKAKLFAEGKEAASSPDGLEISLYAGLKLVSGAKVEVLSKKLANYEAPTLNFQFLLLRFNFFDNREPNAPSNPIPADNTSGQPLNPLLMWSGGDPDAGNTVTYNLYLEANESYPDVLVYSGPNTTFDPGILDPNTDYFWRVVATDQDGATNYGLVWSFRTGASANDPPNKPTTPLPVDGITNTLIYLDLSWAGGDPTGDDVTYDVYLDTISPPAKLLAEDIERTSIYSGALQTSRPYYWKVVAQDEHGRTTSGPVWSFTTGTSTNRPPHALDQYAPNDGAKNIPLLAPVSWWYEGAPDPDRDPVTYTVYLEAEDETPDVPVCVDQPWGESNSCDPGLLKGNTGYYWQVVARDDEGATTTGPVLMFTTADLVFVPMGEFNMGCDACNPSERCSADELPLHAVFLDEFAIDRTEVTNAEYAACVASEACNSPMYNSSRTRPDYYTNPLFADYPVLWVNHEDASRYCQWAYSGSLPTEAQWEKAARGASDTLKFPWGYAEPSCSLLNYTHYNPAGYQACVGDTSPVGSYPLGASPYSVLDMSGNVWEWVGDVYSSTYYSVSPYINPMGPPEGNWFVARGGGWGDYYGDVRAARRSSLYIEHWSDMLGFRCAWQPGEVPSAVEAWQTTP